MNVLSLPDEMLASVLKYKSSENLTELRKISSKIDSVARRYGLDKFKTYSLTITYPEKEVRLIMDLVLNVRKEFTLPPSTDLLDVLKYYFSKIRGVKQLFLYTGINQTNNIISNEVGEFLLGNDCKNITSLVLDRWDISINFNTMRNIMTKLKLKELYIIASLTEFEFSDAVIEGILIETLVLKNKIGATMPMKLSLPYLARLCTIKMPKCFLCEIKDSTVADLITFFKLWTKDMMRNVEYWHFGFSKEAITADETELSTLKCFEDHTVTHYSEGEIKWYFIRK